MRDPDQRPFPPSATILVLGFSLDAAIIAAGIALGWWWLVGLGLISLALTTRRWLSSR